MGGFETNDKQQINYKLDMKNIWKNILLSFIAVLVLLLLIEVIMRLFYPQEIGAHKRSNTLRVKLTPNYRGKIRNWNLSVNSIGLRDREFGKKKKWVFRILVLGDSQTYGLGVEAEETYPKVLERLLNGNNARQKIEVINAGVDTYSNYQKLQYFKESGYKLEPDLVLLGFYIGNDFGENVFFEKKWLKEERPYNELNLFLSSKSHAYNFFKNRFDKLMAEYAMRKGKKGEEVKSITVGDNILFFPNPMTFCKKKYTPEMEEAVGITEKKLLEMAHYIKEHNSKFLIVIIPTMQQVYEKEWHERVKGNLNPEDYDISKPNRILSEFAKNGGILLFDLLPSFKQISENKKLYFWEGHLSQEGYRAAGEEIYKELIVYNLISY